jgi:hypothetical protein
MQRRENVAAALLGKEIQLNAPYPPPPLTPKPPPPPKKHQKALTIPALNYKTASIFGVPIPPPLNIAITPQRFEGELDPATGIMELSFLAKFVFTAGACRVIYKKARAFGVVSNVLMVWSAL